jgi:carbonic anhydrase
MGSVGPKAMSKHFYLLAVIQTVLAAAIAGAAAVRYTRAPSPPPTASGREVERFAQPRGEEKRPSQSDQAAIARELLRGSERFAAGLGRFERDAERPAAPAPRPLAAVLTCTEPEVNPELDLDRPLGDLYVVRTPGLTLDTASVGALEHAVGSLGVEVIVVLGHERCGFLAAAASGEKPPTPNLKLLFEQLTPAFKPALGRPLEDAVHLGMGRQVAAATRAILENSGLLRARADALHLQVLGAVFDPEKGQLRAIPESAASWQSAEGDRSNVLPLPSLANGPAGSDGGSPEPTSSTDDRPNASVAQEVHELASLDDAPSRGGVRRKPEPRAAEPEAASPSAEPGPATRAPPLIPAHSTSAPREAPIRASYEETPPTPTAEAASSKPNEPSKPESPKSEPKKPEPSKPELPNSELKKPGPNNRSPHASDADAKPEAHSVEPTARLRTAPPEPPSGTAPSSPIGRGPVPRDRARQRVAENGSSELGLRAPASPGEVKQVKSDAETVVRKGLRAALPALEACYESELRRNGKLRGKIIVAVAVRGSGDIASSRIAESTLQNPEVLGCITGRLKRLRLPPPGEDVEITLPLSLVPRNTE